MADKLSQQMTDALARSAAHPAGLPLIAGKSELGLFPNTTAGKNVSQKCLADGLLTVVATETKGKAPRDRYGLTDSGWDYLLAEVNPKQVLEDFVRVLESRQGEVGELLDTARRMADSLHGLKEAVARVLPEVNMGRMQGPNPPAPFPKREGGERSAPPSLLGKGAGGLGRNDTPSHSDEPNPPTLFPGREGGARIALLESTATAEVESMILSRLADWSGAAGEDCPLPELYRSLSLLDSPPTIGEFHDCLRKLLADGSLYLHPWTGPLYALPEPAFALLAGHNVSYYASPRIPESGIRNRESGVMGQESDRTPDHRPPNTDS